MPPMRTSTLSTDPGDGTRAGESDRNSIADPITAAFVAKSRHSSERPPPDRVITACFHGWRLDPTTVSWAVSSELYNLNPS